MRLLLVEDDAMLGKALAAGLRQQGHAVDWVRDGSEGLAAALAHDYGAVLLDLGLPRADGLDVLRRLRGRGRRTPVIVVTARDAVEQRIAGLDAGADDYIVKPFDLDELAARLRSVTRRAWGSASGELVAGDVRLDTAARRCTLAGVTVELTAREYMMLEVLMTRAGRIVTRSELEEAVFDWSREVESNVVEVYISQLRRKLGRDFIVTRRGLGYAVEAPEPSAREHAAGGEAAR
jgi:two-component system, OmpR family, response regulator QseB